MKRFIAALLTSLLLTTNSIAEEKIPGKVTGVHEGQIAPYSGVLFSTDAASWVLTRPEATQETIKIEVQHAVDTQQAICTKSIADLQAKSDADAAIAEAVRLDLQRKIDTYTRQIESDEKQTMPCTWCYLVGGVVTGGVIASLATYAATKQ